MSKDSPSIWLPLYIGDYLGDTMHLSTLEHGAYLLLLMAYWKNSGPIPSDDKRLAAMVRMSLSDFQAIRSALEPFFQEENGVWRNKRADKEIKKWFDLKDDRGFGSAIVNFEKNGVPIPERYAERYANRALSGTQTGTLKPPPSPLPSPLPSSSTLPKPSLTIVPSGTGSKRVASQQFQKPSFDDVQSYCISRGNRIKPQAFLAFYESNGWRVGKNPMRNWKAAIVTWENKEQGR